MDLQDFIFKNFSNAAALQGKRHPSGTEICKCLVPFHKFTVIFHRWAFGSFVKSWERNCWRNLWEKINRTEHYWTTLQPAVWASYVSLRGRCWAALTYVDQMTQASSSLLLWDSWRSCVAGFAARALALMGWPPSRSHLRCDHRKKERTVSTDVQYISYVGK